MVIGGKISSLFGPSCCKASPSADLRGLHGTPDQGLAEFGSRLPQAFGVGNRLPARAGAAVVAIPAAWFLSTSWRGYWLLVGAILLLIMVEVLNTGIEAACDAFSREFHIDIQLAKDCGSLAVLISILIALIVWGLAVVETVSGVPL
jgi:diacylglycerol kinase (ATP)